MLGRFEVVSPDGAPAVFRSRKVGSLLALLALNKGREISNATLQDLLWPDSDGDRQSQSFRRAVADLRDALTVEDARRQLVHTDHGRTSIDPDAVVSDAERFLDLLSRPHDPDFLVRGAEALALYGGPLLASIDDDWVFAYRRQYEETYCNGLETLCLQLVAHGQAREAARIAGEGVLVAREREEPYLAAIRAYAALDNRSMALQQFEALERMLDDVFGQTPSAAALAALDEPTSATAARPASTVEAGSDAPTVSGGGLGVDDKFYVERESDTTMRRWLADREPVILVFGPRQVGKTSLLARSAAQLRSEGSRVAVTDFQSFGKSEVERSATLYRSLLHSFASQLELSYEPSWNEFVGANSNLDAHVDKLLKQTTGQVCWAMDEVDRVFGTDYSDDFFGLVRSWHNRRALDSGGPWSRLSLIVSYATEAHLFIKDLNQSPFNVGMRLNLRDFTPQEVVELARRYPGPESRLAAEVYDITKGHPYLTRRALSFLSGCGTVVDLRVQASQEDGPFGDHLRRLYQAVSREEGLREELVRLLKGDTFSHPDTRPRLVAAGLLSPDTLQVRVPAYMDYLAARLV